MNERNENLKHIGLTIGPIYKTMSRTRKTCETWGASYLFSFMMRTIIEKLVSRGIKKEDIIIPYAPGSDENKPYTYGAGLYPDRLIFRSKPGDMEMLTEIICETSEEVAGKIANHLGVKDKTTVRRYIDDYFQFHALEANVTEGESPILELSPYLDTREMEEKFIHCDGDHYIAKFLEKVNNSFLFNDAFDNPPPGIKKKEKFDCLIRIAAGELAQEIGETEYNKIIAHSFNNKNQDEYVIAELKRKLKELEKQDSFKTYHKYIAIVQADGDNFGKTIEAMKSDAVKLTAFSRNLLDYARDAARIIHEYGATPIYIGGDDLFFFAPVANTRARIDQAPIPTVFDLIDTLDTRFKRDFPTASLSYGMSVTYYKFPLAEAREWAYDLLFQRAKHMEKKNSLAFQVLKHSGRAFGAVLQKDSLIYLKFKQLLRQYGGEEKHLNSIVNTTELHRGILDHIGTDMQKVLNFFHNTFDEDIHKENEAFVDTAAKLFFQVFNESPASWNSEEKYDEFYSLLRTLHFLKRKDIDND
jgi:CRISPR-associated protein Cmr2